MSSLHERLGYRYGVKDAILDGLGETPGIGAVNVPNKTTVALDLESSSVAYLARHEQGATQVELKAILSLPAEESLYGLIALRTADRQAAIYGLSRFAASTHDQAAWHAQITHRMAAIQPHEPEAQRPADLSWRASFMPGLPDGGGVVLLSYRGDAFVDVIGAAAEYEGALDDVNPDLWCPSADELETIVK